MSSTSLESPGARARLRVEVPHWLASVSLLDNDLQPVSIEERIAQLPGDPFAGRLDLALAPGAYQVEVTLDGKTQTKWVLAEAGVTAELPAETWTELKIDTAIPMPAGAPALRADDRLTRFASQATRRRATSEARLSLFGTAIVPCSADVAREEQSAPCLLEAAAPRDFDFDVAILDAKGQVVVDLGESSTRRYIAARQVWRCALDLDPGPYRLRARVPSSRTSPAGPVRHRVHPLFLCPGLEHHLFFRCDGPPDLTTLSMHITPLGQTYDPARPEAVVADGVLTALSAGHAQRLLLGSDTLIQMLRGEVANPWLGVLAAYGLMAGPVDDAIQAQIDEIAVYLERGPLRDHPDAQILMLGDSAASRSLAFPPMLLPALRHLQRLAVDRAGLIDPGSPLEQLPSRLVADTAWTAWFEEQPPIDSRQPAADHEPPGSALPPPILAFVTAFPDSAPVFPLTQVDPLSPDEAIRQNATLADHASIIEAASHALEDVRQTGSSDIAVSLDFASGRSLLDLSPEEVSRLTGMPLDLVVKDLELLRTTQTVTADPAALERPLQLLAAAIVGKQAKASMQRLDDQESSTPPSPIETQVRRLTDEIERLRRIKEAVDDERAKDIATVADRLQTCADSLVKRAHLVILADDQGRLRYGNALLRDRLTIREEGAAAVLARMASVFASQDHDLVVVDAARLSPTSPEGRTGADIEIRRSILSSGGQRIGAIYLLRDLTYPELGWAAARQIDAMVPLITLSASMLEFAEPDKQAGHLSELHRVVDIMSTMLFEAVESDATLIASPAA